MTVEEIVNRTIVIYTQKNLNPKSGKPDCPITVREKEHFRYMMKLKLGAVITEKERQDIIEHYKQLFEQK